MEATKLVNVVVCLDTQLTKGANGGNRIAFGGSYDAVSATTGESTGSINTQLINLAAAGLNGYSPAGIGISLFSSVAGRFLNLELSALESDGNGKVVASPRIVTADQVKALIEQGTEIPLSSSFCKWCHLACISESKFKT